jgi:predicted dehydrogenase
MSTPMRVGIVGLGNISGAYLSTLPKLPNLALTAVADIDAGRVARVVGEQPGVAGLTPDELYASPEVDVVLNLTVPAVHSLVAKAAIAAGKHVYGEKPLALATADAAEVLAAAASAGVLVGCAPDTVLGTGTQTARAVLDAGEIGTPVAATAFMTTAGHERWHPDPEFYYQPGGGPLLDMGPYYLTALVTLLGPVRRVVGLSSRPKQTRTIGSGARAGTEFDVEVQTHVSGILEHENGALSTLIMTFDVWAAELPRIEIYGTAGSLSVPDPNGFDGQVRLFRGADGTWVDVAEAGGFAGASRGVGLSELADAAASGRAPRASGELAYHVLDVMEQVLRAGVEGRAVDVESSCPRPAAIPAGARPYA